MRKQTLEGGFTAWVPEEMPDPTADDGSPLLTREELRTIESKIHDSLCESVDDDGNSPCGELRIETDILIDSHHAALDEIERLQALRDALAEALRLYADDANYDWGEPMRETPTGDPDWPVDRVADLGHTARTALALLEETPADERNPTT